jgi:EAL domain-containing protein (putative c-di-GMP-specific phosphodiesterase class I)
VAAKLREAVRGGHDLVGRLGGEEFGILLAGVDAAEAFRVAERARALIRGLSIDGFSLDCSAGVAAWPTDTDTPHRLLDLADAALYQAKRMGRGQTRRVDADSGQAAVDQQRAMVQRLLDRPELVTPVFQPIVSLATGRIAGYEGLSRFPEADGRRPDEWFDLARRCGMGPLLQALALRRMIEIPGRPNRTWLSLNLDAGALATDAVQGALPEDLSGIVIEVTEQELPPDDEALQRTLDGLRARGARIALDDAGAGYAGLQHVVRIRPDIIKLDRSLVRGVDRDAERLALIESFVAFSARTGASLCAEGIETDEELQVLVDARVDLGQGYRLGRPGPPWASPAPEARGLGAKTAT